MTTPNVPLFRKVMEWIEEQAQQPWDQREWDQGSWYEDMRTPDYQLDGFENSTKEACGTTYCIAGYVSYLEGWTPTDINGGYQFTKDGVTAGAPTIAADALGITRTQADWLFFYTLNNPQEIRKIVETQIVGERL